MSLIFEALEEFNRLQELYPKRLSPYHLELNTHRKNYLGYCSWKRKILYIHPQLLNSGNLDEVLDTVRHEVAHAIVGPSKLQRPHGRNWQTIAVILGATPKRCATFTLTGKYRLECKVCGCVWYRHRKPRPYIAYSHCKQRCYWQVLQK